MNLVASTTTIITYLLLLLTKQTFSHNVTSQQQPTAVAAPPTSQVASQSPDRIPDRNPYFKATDELLLDLRHQMITRSIKFDEHFRTLISNSKISLHHMFKDAYGVLYEQNTEIFTSMFEGLEQYYARGGSKISDTMENFFERLYQKIFQVVHASKAFTPSYLECAIERIVNLDTFKNISNNLTNGLRHSFVMARTFEQALNAGVDFIRGIISLGQPQVCVNLINDKLIKNSIAQQPTPRQPCLQFCEQVITRCIGKANLEPLDVKWKTYVSSLAELAKKLGNNYNVENIILPLDVQISEAIMSFQENAKNISAHVFQQCGMPAGETELQLAPIKPITNRLGKRAAPSRQYLSPQMSSPSISGSSSSVMGLVAQNRKPYWTNDNYKAYHEYSRGSTLGGHLRMPGSMGSVPDYSITINQKTPALIDEIKNYMLSTKNFWSHFPTAVCTSNDTLGPNVSNSMRKQFNNCFTEQLHMLDNNSDLRYRLEFNKLVGDLDNMRAKIDQALNGEDVDWTPVPNYTNEKNPNNVIVRPLYTSTVSSTTSTTTTPSPDIYSESSDTEDLPDDYENEEFGSGSTEIPEEEDGDSSTPSDDSDYMDSTEQTPTSTLDSVGDEFDKDPLPPVDNSIDEGLIIPPDAQKSSQSSSKLVIGNESFLLLASLIIVAFIVTCRSVKVIMLDHNKSTVKT